MNKNIFNSSNLKKVQKNPFYILSLDQPGVDLYISALGYDVPAKDASVLKKMNFLRANLSEVADRDIYVSIQREITKNHQDDLSLVLFDDLEACKSVVRSDIGKLNSMRLTRSVSDELYRWNKETLPYLPNLSAASQYQAVKDNWQNIYSLKCPERSATESFIENTLGVTNMSRPYPENVVRAADGLLMKWRDYRMIYDEMTTENIFFGGARENLYKKGIGTISDSLRGNIDSLLYKYSVVQFRKETGCLLNNSILSAFSSTEPLDLKRTICLKEAIDCSLDEPVPNFNSICLQCTEGEIERVEEINNSGTSISPVLLHDINQKMNENPDYDLSVFSELISDMGLDINSLDSSLGNSFYTLVTEWSVAEYSVLNGSFDYPLDLAYIKSLGYTDYEQEFRNNVYRYSYEASLVDFLDRTGLELSSESKIIRGEGFALDAYRSMGLRGAIESPVIAPDDGLSEIYEKAREAALETIVQHHSDTKILSTKELLSLRDAVRKIDKLADVDDLRTEQLSALIVGRTVKFECQDIYRKKCVNGYSFCSEKQSLSLPAKELSSNEI